MGVGDAETLANLPRSTSNAGSSTLPLSLWCRRTMCRRTGLDDRRPSAAALASSAFAADGLLLVALDLERISVACACKFPRDRNESGE
jgi:hypothetical protein